MTAFSRLSCVALLSLMPIGSVHAAEDFDPAIRSAIQNVITQQLDAIAHDDGEKAETYAAPGVRKKFPEPKKFMEMVKSGYGALVRPKRTHFDETTSSPHGPLQKMTVVAADGTIWTAIYSFEQADGGWRITGCHVERLEGQQDI